MSNDYCETCESSELRPLGICRVLEHKDWCPESSDNGLFRVHASCGGAVKPPSPVSGVYFCKRCCRAAFPKDVEFDGDRWILLPRSSLQVVR